MLDALSALGARRGFRLKSLREHSEYEVASRSKDDREHRSDGHAKMGDDARQAKRDPPVQRRPCSAFDEQVAS